MAIPAEIQTLAPCPGELERGDSCMGHRSEGTWWRAEAVGLDPKGIQCQAAAFRFEQLSLICDGEPGDLAQASPANLQGPEITGCELTWPRPPKCTRN